MISSAHPSQQKQHVRQNASVMCSCAAVLAAVDLHVSVFLLHAVSLYFCESNLCQSQMPLLAFIKIISVQANAMCQLPSPILLQLYQDPPSEDISKIQSNKQASSTRKKANQNSAMPSHSFTRLGRVPALSRRTLSRGPWIL